MRKTFCLTFILGLFLTLDVFANLNEISQSKLFYNELSSFNEALNGSPHHYAIINYNVITKYLDSSLYGGSYINDNDNLEILLVKNGYTANEIIDLLTANEYFNESALDFGEATYTLYELDRAYDFLFENMIDFSIPNLSTDIINNRINIGTEYYDLEDEEDIEAKRLELQQNIIESISSSSELRYVGVNNNILDMINFVDVYVIPHDVVYNNNTIIDPDSPSERFNQSHLINNALNTSSIGFHDLNRNYLVTTGHGSIRTGQIMYQGITLSRRIRK